MTGAAYSISSSGATTSRYLGLEVDPNTLPLTAHNFAEEAINGPVKTIALPPTTVSNSNVDAIIALIGTNDAFQSIANPTLRDTFQANLSQIANTYQSAITPQENAAEIYRHAATDTRQSGQPRLCLSQRGNRLVFQSLDGAERLRHTDFT